MIVVFDAGCFGVLLCFRLPTAGFGLDGLVGDLIGFGLLSF